MMLFYAECGCLTQAILDVNDMNLTKSYESAEMMSCLRDCHHAVVEERDTVSAQPCSVHQPRVEVVAQPLT